MRRGDTDSDDDGNNGNSEGSSGDETEDYSDNGERSGNNRALTLLSKDKNTAWNTKPMRAPGGRRSAANVMHNNPGPTRYSTRNVDSPSSAFQLFMRDNVLVEIQRWTNKEGSQVFGDNWKF